MDPHHVIVSNSPGQHTVFVIYVLIDPRFVFSYDAGLRPIHAYALGGKWEAGLPEIYDIVGIALKSRMPDSSFRYDDQISKILRFRAVLGRSSG